MELGIRGRAAVVCASSRGLGFACASALAAEGANVVINGRNEEALQAAVSALRGSCGAKVMGVAADINTPVGRDALLAVCPEPDILVTNNAGPTPKNFADIDREGWIAAVDANMIAPLLLVRAVLPAMKQRRF